MKILIVVIALIAVGCGSTATTPGVRGELAEARAADVEDRAGNEFTVAGLYLEVMADLAVTADLTALAEVTTETEMVVQCSRRVVILEQAMSDSEVALRNPPDIFGEILTLMEQALDAQLRGLKACAGGDFDGAATWIDISTAFTDEATALTVELNVLLTELLED